MSIKPFSIEVIKEFIEKYKTVIETSTKYFSLLFDIERYLVKCKWAKRMTGGILPDLDGYDEKKLHLRHWVFRPNEKYLKTALHFYVEENRLYICASVYERYSGTNLDVAEFHFDISNLKFLPSEFEFLFEACLEKVVNAEIAEEDRQAKLIRFQNKQVQVLKRFL